jgi:hypothetical protein
MTKVRCSRCDVDYTVREEEFRTATKEQYDGPVVQVRYIHCILCHDMLEEKEQ